jgi:hypothetical protein
MPESVADRCTKAHEYIFLLTKSARYYYDAEAIKEPGAESTGPRALRAQKSEARLEEIPGQEPHSLHAPRSKNGATNFRGQGSNRDSENGKALREGRDMSVVGVEAKRNKRSVWEIATQPFSEAHFATFPMKLVEPCIRAGCPRGGTVLDPFNGSGTTGLVALAERCSYIGIELNPEYAEMADRRLAAAISQMILI